MISRLQTIVSTVTIFAAAFLPATALGQQSCESVAGLMVPNTTITSAKVMPAGPFTAPPDMLGAIAPVNVPAFCRVTGVIKPTADSEIKFELWMPTATWNGKFQQVGNGGFAGVIPSRGLLGPLVSGYAVAATDDGHTGFTDVSWAVGHPEKLTDFAYRAVHSTADISKAIIRSFYGKQPGRSYFSGCSEGGREALIEAQRFPDDFDGIIVGAPANFWTHQFAGFVWNEQALLDDPESYIPPDKLPVIQAAALAHCKQLEGAQDGILENPRRCDFDPEEIRCAAADGPNCLNAKQVAAVRKIYAGPSNPRTHEQIYPGYLPGNEVAHENWLPWITGAAPGKSIQAFFGNVFFGQMVFENPKWAFRGFSFDSDLRSADQKFGTILNAINPDLERFRARGGKIIQYHGWADSAVAPVNSINYYEDVVSAQVISAENDKGGKRGSADALKRTQSFYRLFMVPGMGHCSGGPGADDFGNQSPVPPPQIDARHDLVSALDNWVDHGVAPDEIIATGYVDGNPAKGVVITHPLCPYPQEAKRIGRGSTKNSDDFVCRLPAHLIQH